MYQSFGEFLIVEKASEEAKTTSGIILSNEKATNRFKVVCPPFNYLDLKDKIVIAVNEQVVMMLPDNRHYTINFNNIVAIED